MKAMAASNIVAVSIDLRLEIKVIAVPMHILPLDKVNAELDLLWDELEKYKDRSFVIFGDFNAKSTFWGIPVHAIDSRGD